jgi:hypothetical protein
MEKRSQIKAMMQRFAARGEENAKRSQMPKWQVSMKQLIPIA